MLSAGRPSKHVKEKTLSDITTQKKVRVNFDLDEDLHTQLKLYAIKHKKTVKEILTEQIALLLK
ncbi:hypothetical protein [Wohlfahrtiimonas chitiniclastica]|uniref:hypothetical protein n=1 Tax=Wohlfahrtiimonas chitiniclastica TaxID=400946 RepID=UPI0007B69907|nr:hypothetical protein [Wohlfahrtiimonas chitiniclastica]KZX37279.1 hypothetical protein A6V30_10070 [Wohlfahrtiimonas chitiniclastica]MBS7821569.1 chromosome partitioning protein ParB [Wohlfahrtiimonas chitiniclastica]OYQ82387.1 hypothetical protein B9T14_09995 [Wohlfahrtiimonas chitiniclastica]OYQ83421.1 hypothetical protein B9T15_10025 [Wohlfahrtiimonas chitiniclastica]OYQ85901.1 hypothetical protein B9T21_09785 [Wohlfahrtiimonas chitiniclastica]